MIGPEGRSPLNDAEKAQIEELGVCFGSAQVLRKYAAALAKYDPQIFVEGIITCVPPRWREVGQWRRIPALEPEAEAISVILDTSDKDFLGHTAIGSGEQYTYHIL